MTLSHITPLQRIMREQGRRQDWLAAQLGVDEAQVSRWVNGKHTPLAHTQRAIADALGSTVGSLWPEPGHGSESSTTSDTPRTDRMDSLGEAA